MAHVEICRNAANNALIGWEVTDNSTGAAVTTFYDPNGNVVAGGRAAAVGTTALATGPDYAFDTNSGDTKGTDRIIDIATRHGCTVFGSTQTEQSKLASMIDATAPDKALKDIANPKDAVKESVSSGAKRTGQSILQTVILGGGAFVCHSASASQNHVVSTLGKIGTYVLGGLALLVGGSEVWNLGVEGAKTNVVQGATSGLKAMFENIGKTLGIDRFAVAIASKEQTDAALRQRHGLA